MHFHVIYSSSVRAVNVEPWSKNERWLQTRFFCSITFLPPQNENCFSSKLKTLPLHLVLLCARCKKGPNAFLVVVYDSFEPVQHWARSVGFWINTETSSNTDTVLIEKGTRKGLTALLISGKHFTKLCRFIMWKGLKGFYSFEASLPVFMMDVRKSPGNVFSNPCQTWSIQ